MQRFMKRDMARIRLFFAQCTKELKGFDVASFSFTATAFIYIDDPYFPMIVESLAVREDNNKSIFRNAWNRFMEENPIKILRCFIAFPINSIGKHGRAGIGFHFFPLLAGEVILDRVYLGCWSRSTKIIHVATAGKIETKVQRSDRHLFVSIPFSLRSKAEGNPQVGDLFVIDPVNTDSFHHVIGSRS